MLMMLDTRVQISLNTDKMGDLNEKQMLEGIGGLVIRAMKWNSDTVTITNDGSGGNLAMSVLKGDKPDNRRIFIVAAWSKALNEWTYNS